MNESGKAYYKRGDHLQARREFERALMDSPKNPDYAFNVAAAMNQEGDHLAAEKMYRYTLTLDPSHQPAYHGMAAMMMKDGRTTEANDLISTWAATQPYSPEASTELAWLKTEQGDLDGADRELVKALRQNPRHSRALAQLGRVHSKSGRRSEAAADYSRSLFMDPQQPETQAELASLGNDVYGSPALQMAAAMPLYDPSMQGAAYPAFTQSLGQPQLAANPMSEQGWTSSPPSYVNASGMSYPSTPMGDSMPQAQGVSYSQPMGQSQWSHPQQQMSMMNVPMSYPTSTYPGVASMPSGAPQQYSSARPTTSFFQPQQSFQVTMPNEIQTSTLMPTQNISDPMQASSNDAPSWDAGQMTSGAPMLVPDNRWNSPPAMNASYGNAVPAAQMSSAPVVPAF